MPGNRNRIYEMLQFGQRKRLRELNEQAFCIKNDMETTK